MTRYAVVQGGTLAAETIATYLPANYTVVGTYVTNDDRRSVIIAGNDSAGWTLDDYVIPRLASGLYFARELIVKEDA